MKRQLDTERADFSAHVSASTRAAESTMQRLRGEEERLHRLREEMALEREKFAIQRSAVSHTNMEESQLPL